MAMMRKHTVKRQVHVLDARARSRLGDTWSSPECQGGGSKNDSRNKTSGPSEFLENNFLLLGVKIPGENHEILKSSRQKRANVNAKTNHMANLTITGE